MLVLYFMLPLAQTYIGVQSHWQTVPSMKIWVAEVAYPYYVKTCEQLKLKVGEQAGILQIDVYRVHICDEYQERVRDNYPFFSLIFIPAGTTGVLINIVVLFS